MNRRSSSSTCLARGKGRAPAENAPEAIRKSGAATDMRHRRSLADVMGSADGDVRVIMDGGSISWLAVEPMGVDIGQALILYIEDDDKIPIRCTAGRITFVDGKAGFSPFIMDTTDSVLYLRGGADLKAQTPDMQVEADAKDFSLLDVNAPVAVRGKMGDPKVSIGPIEGFPLIEAGDAENIACGKLIQTVLGGA
ncbi:MAG TPA: hypothetical protein PLR41_09950 [Alphaproteobacteria bacterium]|nr:hypothetical protein [Alphaproteobacteria bacterium]